MRVRAKASEHVRLPDHAEPYARQRFLSAGKEYAIYAVQVCEDGLVLFQFVDDLGLPEWQPCQLFDVVDTSIPEDWRCNVFAENQGTLLALGPKFVVENEQALSDMIELVADQVDLFWKRVDAIDQKAAEEAEEQRLIDS